MRACRTAGGAVFIVLLIAVSEWHGQLRGQRHCLPAPALPVQPETAPRVAPPPARAAGSVVLDVAVSTSGHDHCLAAAGPHGPLVSMKVDEVVGVPSFGTRDLRTSIPVDAGIRRSPPTVPDTVAGAWKEVYRDFERHLAENGTREYRVRSLVHNVDSNDVLLPNFTNPPAWAPALRFERYLQYSHHLAHAAIGFFDSPFQTAFIASFDGGSDDGPVCMHFGNRSADPPIERLACGDTNLGIAYMAMVRNIPEVQRAAESCRTSTCTFGLTASLLMAYSTHGTPVRGFTITMGKVLTVLPNPTSLYPHDLAASVQYWLQQLVCSFNNKLLKQK